MTGTGFLPFSDRVVLVLASVSRRADLDPEGRVSDSDLLDACEDWTTSTFEDADESWEDYRALRDVAYEYMTAGRF